MFRKALAVILALCSIFALCACGGQQTAPAATPSAPVPTPTPEIVYVYMTPEVPPIETIIPEKPTASYITGVFKITQDINNLLILAEDNQYYYFPLNWYSTQDLDLKEGQKVKIVYQGTLDKEFGMTYIQPVTVLGVLPVKQTNQQQPSSGIWIVDWTPVPVWTENPYYPPQPQPTSVPSYITKHGTVDSVNSDGGGIYVGVTYDDGTSGRYDITNLWSNPPVIGTRVVACFEGINLVSFSAE